MSRKRAGGVVRVSRLVSCVPAYGRDYNTKEEVAAAWAEGLDFKVEDLFIRGTYVGKYDDLETLDVELKIRFNKKEDFVIVRSDGTVVLED